MAMSHVDWPTTKVKTLNWVAPPNNNFYVRIKYIPFGWSILVRRGELWAKDIG
jgi:hypothetical protein